MSNVHPPSSIVLNDAIRTVMVVEAPLLPDDRLAACEPPIFEHGGRIVDRGTGS